MDINIEINDIYIDYLDKKQKIQIFFGGSSSGKSFFIAQKIIIDNLQGVNWLCCRNVARTIRQSVFNEILKAIANMNLSERYSINKSDMQITCLMNNKQILFAGLDDPEKIKSITPRNGVLERVFIEEATEIKIEAYKQLTKRLRGKSDKAKYIILAFNPIFKEHWIYKEFFKNWLDNEKAYEDKDLTILKTTYKDNHFLEMEDRERLENETDPYYYQVYTLGNFGVLGNIIFNNWEVKDLSGIKNQFTNVYNGLDFGYSKDPNALIRVHIDSRTKEIYVFDEMYACSLTDDELSKRVREKIGSEQVICDSAEPKTIDFLNMNGVKAIPAFKGKDSVNFGIRFLQSYKIIIDVRCQNFKNEIQLYRWQEDIHGNVLNRPVDKDNHLLDALRYATEPLQVGFKSGVGKRI